MRTSPLGIIAALGSLLLACESGKSPGQAQAMDRAPAASAAPQTAPPRAAPPKVVDEKPAAQGHGSSSVEWRGNVDWHTWDEGLVLAGKSGKPIFVLVYADWCPHCRSLGPIFAEAEMEVLSKSFVMVRQNHDDDPAWLQPYKQHGSYVPRIFFFDPKGKMREDVTSGHPRYPYFYASEQPAFLKQSMRRVIGS